MKPLFLILCLLLAGGTAWAGIGWDCPRGGKEYYNEYFNEQELVKTEYCKDEKGNIQIAVGDKNYPNCKDFGWKDYDEFETDFWGNPKCDKTCLSAIGIIAQSEAQKVCLKRPEGVYRRKGFTLSCDNPFQVTGKFQNCEIVK